MLKKIIKAIKYPSYILFWLDNKRIITLNDKKYVEILYHKKTKEKLNLNDPKTFNEKLQWLKLYDRNPEYTKMVDKYEGKEYVADIIGKEYVIPTLGVWEKFKDIDFEKLPNQFVLKCTHDSGSTIICKDKEKFDYKAAEKKINRALKINYYYLSREWPYKNIKPRIIAEKYMVDESKTELKDYKFYCFDGVPRVVDVCSNRSEKLQQSYFDMEWNKINVTEGGSIRNENITKPTCFEEMKQIASKLSQGIRHVRIDLYEIENRVYFSEITFYSGTGLEDFEPKEFNRELGDMIVL